MSDQVKLPMLWTAPEDGTYRISGAIQIELRAGQELWHIGQQDTDTPKRLFTEDEVRAIALQAIGMIRSAAKTGIHVGQACGYVGKACLDAGIVLDPTH